MGLRQPARPGGHVSARNRRCGCCVGTGGDRTATLDWPRSTVAFSVSRATWRGPITRPSLFAVQFPGRRSRIGKTPGPAVPVPEQRRRRHRDRRYSRRRYLAHCARRNVSAAWSVVLSSIGLSLPPEPRRSSTNSGWRPARGSSTRLRGQPELRPTVRRPVAIPQERPLPMADPGDATRCRSPIWSDVRLRLHCSIERKLQ